MAATYFQPAYWKAKAHVMTAHKSTDPVLSDEDEAFLNSITSENPPALPPRPDVMSLPVAGESHGGDAQLALFDGAQNIALPRTPDEMTEEPSMIADAERAPRQTRKNWSWLRRDSRDTKNQAHEAHEAQKAAAESQTNEDEVVDDHEARKEREDMLMVLENLNLAAVNNRVFSISDETQELLKKFNLVFKDLIVGGPTAYRDLESLLTNADGQLQKTFSSLPPFLQSLVKSLPDKMTKGIAPTALAAAAESAQKRGGNVAKAGKAAGTASQFLKKTPTLKDLIGKPGAIASLMRSIMAFLRTRFPAFMGLNVLWSLALFILLIVFWYCHKRGREVRLEREGEELDEEVKRLDSEYESQSRPQSSQQHETPREEQDEYRPAS